MTTRYGPHGKGRKLTHRDAQEIRLRVRAGERMSDLAARYGVHRHTIERIVKQQTYRATS